MSGPKRCRREWTTISNDTRRSIEAVPFLSAEDRRKIFEANARRVFPRIAARTRALA